MLELSGKLDEPLLGRSSHDEKPTPSDRSIMYVSRLVMLHAMCISWLAD